MNSLDFYRARVAEARAEADEATLSQVRERCERSEAAWQALADQARRTVEFRAEDEKRKAEAGLTC